ncbi:phenylpropionate dioxygenase-like ring-hydroxylating dioxygenase large terminal subunit [Catenulispora sp. GAS73]|uniref:aromatic ring-hydroxylating oxygenase subunit alpha n=1 Tax=Catenulispora sp. GAS73 TaxID=3156269 RepID=UPI0035150632
MTAAYSETVQQHIAARTGMPRELYTSPELYEAELAAVFQRSWLYAGHVSEIARPGQYLTVASGDESVIVARGNDETISAFYNVCRHRGARLVDEGCGSARRFVCPYHQWTYRLDGSLLGAPRMGKDFDPAEHPLPTVAVEVWQGLVFVNLAADPGPGVGALFADGEAVVAPFALAEARVVHTEDYLVAANWKLVWENAQECYHCMANHPEFLKAFDLASINEPDWRECDVQRSDDRRVQYAKLPLRSDAVSLTVDGRPAVAKLLGEFAAGRDPYTVAIHLKPTVAVVCSPDYAIVLTDSPDGLGSTKVRVSWLVHPSAEAGTDYDVDNLIKVWDQTNRQDWKLCERAQLGVRSQSYVPGPLAADEASVLDFYRAYAQLLADAGL